MYPLWMNDNARLLCTQHSSCYTDALGSSIVCMKFMKYEIHAKFHNYPMHVFVPSAEVPPGEIGLLLQG